MSIVREVTSRVPGLSAVIPNRDGASVLPRCLEHLAAARVDEVIVVDDGSRDDSPERAAALGARVVHSPRPGFSAAVNHGVATARGSLLLVLNSDAFVHPETPVLLAGALDADPRLGGCAAALSDEEGRRASTFGRDLTLFEAIRKALSLPSPAPAELGGVQDVEFVPLACVLVRREAWEAVGGLDERYRFYFEDHDLCWRLRRAGYRLAVSWDARAVHLEGGSSRARGPHPWFRQYHESRLRYLRKRYPLAWPLYLLVWVPSALAHSLLWLGRGDPAWASAYARSALAGLD
jgi:N-acetylglucosaminyl-diphospho-decaprenol L-rhamnosyltransferase